MESGLVSVIVLLMLIGSAIVYVKYREEKNQTGIADENEHTKTCKDPMVYRGHADAVLFAAFSPDEKRMVTTSRHRTARLNWYLVEILFR